MSNVLDFFPLGKPREKQIRACEYIQDKIQAGFSDIVLAAPTGVGKSAIGMAVAQWISSQRRPSGILPGAYYLVTQKLLQDQLTKDIPRYAESCQNVVSIKSSEEYPCSTFGTCGAGLRINAALARAAENNVSSEKLDKAKKCPCIELGTCPYKKEKSAWLLSRVGITNYAFLLASKAYTPDIKKRQLLVCDETHSLEDQIIRFVDGTVSLSQARKWLDLRELPDFKTVDEYVGWLSSDYVPKLREIYDGLLELELLDDSGEKSKEVTELDKIICKLNRAVEQIKANKDNWVFWREESRDKTEYSYVVRPVFAAPFANESILDAAPIRLYMSAYPGVPDVFCRNLGLDRQKVAWASLSSDFEVRRRQVHYWPAGSMGSASKNQTLPNLLVAIVKLARKHKDRGLIHCASYELGDAIAKSLTDAGFGDRVCYPKNADARSEAMDAHAAKEGSILISPSVTEGFDFADSLARWQIIPKIGFGYLGDKQIAKKMELDPDWYMMKAVMTTIQSCGRVCRSHTDYGVTYVLDKDFSRLWKKHNDMFPKWFKESVIFHDV